MIILTTPVFHLLQPCSLYLHLRGPATAAAATACYSHLLPTSLPCPAVSYLMSACYSLLPHEYLLQPPTSRVPATAAAATACYCPLPPLFCRPCGCPVVGCSTPAGCSTLNSWRAASPPLPPLPPLQASPGQSKMSPLAGATRAAAVVVAVTRRRAACWSHQVTRSVGGSTPLLRPRQQASRPSLPPSPSGAAAPPPPRWPPRLNAS